jgi:hypothetical protein
LARSESGRTIRQKGLFKTTTGARFGAEMAGLTDFQILPQISRIITDFLSSVFQVLGLMSQSLKSKKAKSGKMI